MAQPTEMVGQLENVCAAKTLERQTTVFHNSSMTKYGKEFHTAIALDVRYTKFDEYIGHYDCLVPISSSTLITPEMISPLLKQSHKKRTNRSSKSIVVTSSHYMNDLYRTKRKCVVGEMLVRSTVKRRLHGGIGHARSDTSYKRNSQMKALKTAAGSVSCVRRRAK